MAILKHIVSKSSNYGAALEYLIFKHDELRKTPILDQKGNRIIHNVISFRGWHSEWNSDLQVHYSFLFSFLFSVLKIGFVHFIHDAVHILRGQLSAGK